MLSFKVTVSVNQPVEIKTRLKIETDSTGSNLPFENLMVETIPTEMEAPSFQLRIINSQLDPTIKEKDKFKNLSPKKPWWQKIWHRTE